MKRKRKRKISQASLNNLTSRKNTSPEKLKENMRHAQKHAHKNAARKRAFKEIAHAIVEMRPTANVYAMYQTFFPDISNDFTKVKDMMTFALAKKALLGDIYAFEKFQELLDELPERYDTKACKINTQLQFNFNYDFDSFCKNAGYATPYTKQREFMNFAFLGGMRFVEAARRYGKTDYIAICAVAFYIYKDNQKTFLIINKDRNKAVTILSQISHCLKANGVELEVDNKSALRVKGLQGKQDNVKAYSTRMNLKQNHVDFAICDDVVDAKDKQSKAERVFIEEFYNAVSGITNNVIFLGQPVHARDLYAKIKPLIQVLSFPYGTIPELDENLEAKRAAGVDEAFIQANYFLKVSAQDTLPFNDIAVVDYFPLTKSVMYIDGSDGKGDDTSIACYTKHLGKFVGVGFNFSSAYYDLDKEIALIWKSFKCAFGFFETNKFGTHPVILLNRSGFKFEGVESSVNKKAKIQNAASMKSVTELMRVNVGNFEGMSQELVNANRRYIEQIKNYEYISDRDDAPDNLASIMLRLGIITMSDGFL
jgi:hypothetical protein